MISGRAMLLDSFLNEAATQRVRGDAFLFVFQESLNLSIERVAVEKAQRPNSSNDLLHLFNVFPRADGDRVRRLPATVILRDGEENVQSASFLNPEVLSEQPLGVDRKSTRLNSSHRT